MTEKKVENISPNKLRPDPTQPRKSFPENELKEMENSIKKHGIKIPLLVDNDSVIIDGERRWLCAKKLNIKVPIIRTDVKDPADRKILQLVIDYHKIKHSPIERAKALDEIRKNLMGGNYEPYHKKEGHDKGISLVSELTGIPESTVRNYLKLLETPSEVQEAIKEGYVSQTDVLELMKLPVEKQTEYFNKIGRNEFPDEVKLEDKKSEKLTVPNVREDYKDYVIQWVDSVEDILDMGKAKKLKPPFAKIIKSKFDEKIIPYYKLLEEKCG